MFEWDEKKNKLNIETPVLTTIDDRGDYGEVREISIGTIEGIVFLTVVHTDRHDKTRIISARRASRAERKRYEEALQKRIKS